MTRALILACHLAAAAIASAVIRELVRLDDKIDEQRTRVAREFTEHGQRLAALEARLDRPDDLMREISRRIATTYTRGGQ